MSKSEHLSLLVSVLGLSGCGPDVYKGPGKSSLCFNLLHPTEYLKEHSSKLTLEQFESPVIDKQHYVYWGTKTEYYYKLPKSKKSTGEKILVTVNFQIFEQTEFIEDVTKKSFPAKHEYTERALKLPHSSNRLQFKTVPLVLTPEKYNAAISPPSTKGMKNGYIFAIDVSKGCPTFPHQLSLLKKLVKPHKKVFVIAATKYDQVDPTFFEEVKTAGQALNVEVIPTSIEMEDGRWVTEVFKYLAIKLFNLQSDDPYGVTGDSYLRYATEPPPTMPPPTKPPVKKAEQMPKSKSIEERASTPPIPPRNYRSESMPQSPPSSLDDSGYGNFIRQKMDQTSIDGGFSMPNPAMTEPHTTEIPPAILARKPKTLDRHAKLAFPVDSEAVSKPRSFSENYSVPPLPPKPKPSYPPTRKLSIPSPPKSPILKPKKSPVPQPSQAMAARPLPKLPFISDDDDNTNHYSMRCDYDKIDYTKMRHLRNLTKKTGEQNDSAQRQRVKPKLSKAKLSIPNPTVPARNIPRKKEVPMDSPQTKHKPPPVAKKPTVKPRRRSVNAGDLVKQDSLTSPTKTYGGAQSLEYEDTVAIQDVEYDDTGYVNEGENRKPVSNTNQPKYPPRCIPRKYYFLNGRRALPES